MRIRPWLDEPFDVERDIWRRVGITDLRLEDFSPSRRLRATQQRCWDMPNHFGTYPGMVAPLEIAD